MRRSVFATVVMLVLARGIATRAADVWVFSGELAVPRAQHAAFLMADGSVFVAGNINGGGADFTSAFFDPATGMWSAGPPSHLEHKDAVGVRLADGRILVAGGRIGTSARNTAEVFNPTSNTWTVTGSMNRSRVGHTLTLLPNGLVLAVGGYNFTWENTAELYNPATGTWTFTGSTSTAMWLHTATLLNDGRVLVTGGENYHAAGGPDFRAAHLYDPASGAWSAAPSLLGGRSGHRAALLPDGRVMIVGGKRGFDSSGLLATTEIFDGVSWTFAASMIQPRMQFPLIELADGTVLIIGGQSSYATTVTYTASTERYDPATDTWTSGSALNTARAGHSATVLADGTVLVAGGYNVAGPLRSTELLAGADRDAPVTTATPSTFPNGNGWHNRNVTLTLQSTDNASSVQSITYVLAGAQTGGLTVPASTAAIEISVEGSTTVTYYATDTAGNVEAHQSVTVNIDKTAPVVADLADVSVAASSPSGAVVTFNVSADDALSGLASTTVAPLASGMLFPLGTTTVFVTAVDAAGNPAESSFTVTVNPATLQSITVSPANATLAPGENQNFQAIGHFSDGSTKMLPSAGGGTNPPLWDARFLPSIDFYVCSTAQYPLKPNGGSAFGGQVFGDRDGSVHETWSPMTPVVNVDGTIDAANVVLSLACTNGAASGTINAQWTGTQYEGTYSFNGGAASGAVVIAKWVSNPGAVLPTVEWVSTNTAVADIDAMGNARAYVPGQTSIIASAGGISCQPDGCATLTAIDTRPPYLNLPNDMIAEANGPSGAIVNYWVSANDSVDGQRPVTCDVPAGSMFAFGPTMVTCSASDTSGNTASGSFTITVQDTRQPFLALPGNQTRQATSPAGAVVTYSASANDSVDGPLPVTCSPASGSTFPFGPTPVSCSATDAHGNTRTGNFTITVQDTNAPFLSLPGHQTREATSPAGAVVTYSASANDSVDGPVDVACNPASGSTFGFGATTVSCTATDAHGNTRTGSFNVTVQDTTKPQIVTSGNVTIAATTPSGAQAVFAATAMDSVDGAVSTLCTPASGSLFAIGTTSVTCSATDAHQNSASATLLVTVLSPQEVLANLIIQVGALDFQQASSLLQNVLKSLSKDNTGAACGQLDAFINQVTAQSGKSLTASEAGSLIQSAADAKGALGCPAQ